MTECKVHTTCVFYCIECSNGKILKHIYLYIYHSLIRVVLIQSCSAGVENFTNYLFCHPQFTSGVIQNIVVPFSPLFVYVDCYQNNQFYRVKKINFQNFALMAL